MEQKKMNELNDEMLDQVVGGNQETMESLVQQIINSYSVYSQNGKTFTEFEDDMMQMIVSNYVNGLLTNHEKRSLADIVLRYSNRF